MNVTGEGSCPSWLHSQSHCYFSKITGTSLLKQAALPDYVEDILILHSLVLTILKQANYPFNFLSNLEFKCGKCLSWYC